MAYRKVASIELVFENCDTCIIPKVDFGFEGITESTFTINSDSEVFSYKQCRSVVLRFSKESLQTPTNFDNQFEGGNLLLGQLNFRDVVAIQINYEDGEEEVVYVPYDDENENQLGSPNKNQKNEFKDDGSCVVSISR